MRILVIATSLIVIGTMSGRAFSADVAAPPQDELYRALVGDATLTFHARSYLLDRTDTGGSDPAAWAVGGWIGYETGWVGNFLKLGAVGYGSVPLWAPEDRDGTLLLMPGQEGYAVLGQAYAALRYQDQVATFYRQLVNQPEVNPQDNRMTPNTFEAISLKGDLGPIDYYAGYLFNMKKRNSEEFINMAAAAGVNSVQSDMLLGGLEFTPADNLKFRTSAYMVPNLLASSYTDGVWTTPFATDSKFRLSGQFMYQGGIGDDLLTGCTCDTWVAGTKGDFIYRGLTLTSGYTQTSDAYNWQAPYGSWPGYTSMIVKDFDRAGEGAFLAGLSYDFGDIGATGLVFTTAVAIDLNVGNNAPKWQEYDFTLDYKLSALKADWAWLAPLSLRARYALVNASNNTQINDYRVILNYEVQLHGNDM